jgi:hypothetical protein
MKAGFCYIAERGEPSDVLPRIVEAFGRAGIALANPLTRRTTRLADDGDQVDASVPDMVWAADVRSWVSFQLWYSSDTDVVCSFRRLDAGLVRHAYPLDGLDADERDRIVRWATEYFRQAATEGTAQLLVVDPPGRAADVDWDAVVKQIVGFPVIVSDVMGLPSGSVEGLRLGRRYEKERVGRFELLKAIAEEP